MSDVDVLNDMLSCLAQLERRTTALVADLMGGAVNELLFSGTVVLDAAGMFVADWPADYAAVSVFNFGPDDMTVTSNATSGSAPGNGPGVAVIGGGGWSCLNIAGHQLALYGTARALVGLEVFVRPQPPAYGSN